MLVADGDLGLDAIRDRIRTLSISATTSGLQGRSWLAELDQRLPLWHENESMSMTKFKQVVKEHAICLSDLKEYGFTPSRI